MQKWTILHGREYVGLYVYKNVGGGDWCLSSSNVWTGVRYQPLHGGQTTSISRYNIPFCKVLTSVAGSRGV